MAEAKSMASRLVHSSSPSEFLKTYGPRLSGCFFGLAAVRIWTQCCLYDRYTATDSGALTIASNLVRVALIMALVLLFSRVPLSTRARRAMEWLSVTAMTLCAVCLLATVEYPAAPLVPIAAVLGALGIVWGGGMWIEFFDRLDEGEALIYAFGCLGVSALLGLFLGMIPQVAVFAVGLFMPTLSFVSFRQAQDQLDERRDIVPEPTRDDAYDREPRVRFALLLVGLALLEFALGVARGFPEGVSIPLSLPYQVAHQLLVVGMCVAVVFWVLVRGRRLSFGALWWFEVGLMVSGVVLIVAGDFMQLGAMLITVSNTFMLGLLWYTVYDFSRHSFIPSYLVLGAVWAVHLLPREVGRYLMFLCGPSIGQSVFIVAVLVCLLSLSMAVVLRNCQPARPFFAAFGISRAREQRLRAAVLSDEMASEPAGVAAKPQVAESEMGDVPAERAAGARGFEPVVRDEGAVVSQGGKSDVLDLEGKPAEPDLSEKPAAPSENPLQTRCNELQERYGLTDRERDMAWYLAQGRSKSAISQELHLSENTVKGYTRGMYSKLCIHSKQELIDLLQGMQE